MLRRACAVTFRCVRLPSSGAKHPQVITYQVRPLSKPPKEGRALPKVVSDNAGLPEAPPMLPEDEGFLEDLANANSKGFDSRADAFDVEAETSELPEPPDSASSAAGFDIDEEEEGESVDDIEEVPYFPPVRKFVGSFELNPLLNSSKEHGMVAGETHIDQASQPSEVGQPSGYPELNINPLLEPALDAWLRAIAPTPASGPMPLHELANRSTKIKELTKLGVDFSRIAARHGDLERLLHLDWENQIKPHIRFLVDCGIQAEHLGTIFTRNTKLLWTDKDDIQVRLNYLEAKHFTKDQITNIINKAPFWLTLSTKELDSRLGFIQRTFKLPGNDVRFIASSFPTVVSSQRWTTLVDTIKLMDRELGFKEWERKKLLFSNPQCFLRPTLLRKAFDLCHNEVGLSHHVLVHHANLLVTRVKQMRPRYDFLKFLKRDIFNIEHPLYLSPSWLWKGTVEEFCEQAAKTSVEEYETFLKHNMS